jgi:lipopolysaccharide/colanic/teichoic acid biosynthesis glycosyltransferase
MVAAGFLIAAVQCKLAVKPAARTPIAIRVLAAVLLLYQSPVFLIVSLLIKLESPGPVFVWSSHPRRAVYFPTFRCPRGTLGWILRKTRLHMLPLLYSVLRGDLTLKRRVD